MPAAFDLAALVQLHRPMRMGLDSDQVSGDMAQTSPNLAGRAQGHIQDYLERTICGGTTPRHIDAGTLNKAARTRWNQRNKPRTDTLHLGTATAQSRTNKSSILRAIKSGRLSYIEGRCSPHPKGVRTVQGSSAVTQTCADGTNRYSMELARNSHVRFRARGWRSELGKTAWNE